MLINQLLIAVGVLAAWLIGPLIAFFFMRRRKLRARAARRSPINRKLLRGPGETLREQIEDLRTDVASNLAS